MRSLRDAASCAQRRAGAVLAEMTRPFFTVQFIKQLSVMKQEQFLDVVDRDEATRRFQAVLNMDPLGDEIVSIEDAWGRVCSRDVAASVNVPNFDRSNYDGFAIQAQDTHGATEDRERHVKILCETITPGAIPRSVVHSGTAVPIATGGMLPRGADAVLMIEDTDAEDDTLLIRRSIFAGHGVTFAGTDIAEGETVLRIRERLTSRETGLLAAIGCDRLHVYRQPQVGIFSTGDEITQPGDAIQPGQVFDSNAQILADAVREAGGHPVRLGIVCDDAAILRERLSTALQQCDMVLLSGGTSKGAGDICYRVVHAVTRPGVAAHGVALKPGKPICLASHEGKAVVVLPGFPTSAIFTFHEFVAPVIRRLAGLDALDVHQITAKMAVRVNSQVGRTEYLLVGLVPGDDSSDETGPLAAYPMGKGSGSITTFSRADGFVTIDRHQEIVEQDAKVDVCLLGQNLRQADLIAIGSHCIGLDWLLGQLQRVGFHTKFLAVGSTGGLDAAKRRECDLAGMHLLDPVTGSYNRPFLSPDLVLIEGYRRMQGIVYRRGDDRFEGHTVEQAIASAVLDGDCRMINRNLGSGTRILIDQLLRQVSHEDDSVDRSTAGPVEPAGYALQARNHHAVAAAVAQRRADWGIAIEGVTRDPQLGFLPVTEEHYDFVVPVDRLERPAVKALRELLSEPNTREQLAHRGCRFPE
jgi:putative molybdopterin biosynthesis protein